MIRTPTAPTVNAESAACRGFTLLEMLTVVALLGLIGGLAFPAVERQVAHASFLATAAEVELSVRRAQADAVRQNRTVQVESLARRDDASTRIDEPAPILFFRDGTSNGGTKAISAGARTFRIIVDAQTGVVTSSFQ